MLRNMQYGERKRVAEVIKKVAQKGETFEIIHSAIRWSGTVRHERIYII